MGVQIFDSIHSVLFNLNSLLLPFFLLFDFFTENMNLKMFVLRIIGFALKNSIRKAKALILLFIHVMLV